MDYGLLFLSLLVHTDTYATPAFHFISCGLRAVVQYTRSLFLHYIPEVLCWRLVHLSTSTAYLSKLIPLQWKTFRCGLYGRWKSNPKVKAWEDTARTQSTTVRGTRSELSRNRWSDLIITITIRMPLHGPPLVPDLTSTFFFPLNCQCRAHHSSLILLH